MSNLCVVGAQWGDEGKGKVVDHLAANTDIVVRFAGGSNAGHTLVVGDRKVVVHLLPSGITRKEAVCVLGDGMVIDLGALLEELEDLERIDLRPSPQRLKISNRAHIVLPYHREIDRLRESKANAIGTTCRGIGPAYEDKAARRGLRICDLVNESRTRERLEPALAAANSSIELYGGTALAEEPLIETVLIQAKALRPYFCATAEYLADAVDKGSRLLFEGAQGVLLDIDHGTYPFVTSSSALSGGACTGAGVAPQALGSMIGVAKAYVTRVGEGPFPTEIVGEAGERLRAAGNEFGATTGRPRRCGWLDLPALRYAVRLSGLRWLALTKLDVLASLTPLKVCVGYRLRGESISAFPACAADLEDVEPILEEVPRIDGGLSELRDFDALPQTAKSYIQLIEKMSGARVGLVSVGPARDQTIIRPGAFS